MNKKNYTHWFPHENNSLTQRHLKAMRSEHGMQGYGCWWGLLEILNQQDGYKLDITDAYAINELADDLRIDVGFMQRFVDDCLHKYHLLESDGQYLWSPAMITLMQPLEEKRVVLSERGKKGAAVMHRKRIAQASDNDGTSMAQAEEVNGTSIAQASKKIAQHNITQHNTTQNNTTENNMVDVEGIETKQGEEYKTIITPQQTLLPAIPFADMQLMKQRSLNDKEFSYITMQSFGIDAEKLALWMDAFNRKLAFEGDTIKNDKEYRRHFANWLKYRDLKQEDPASYVPVNVKAPPGKGARTLPFEPRKPSAKELLDEHQRNEQDMIRKLKSM